MTAPIQFSSEFTAELARSGFKPVIIASTGEGFNGLGIVSPHLIRHAESLYNHSYLGEGSVEGEGEKFSDLMLRFGGGDPYMKKHTMVGLLDEKTGMLASVINLETYDTGHLLTYASYNPLQSKLGDEVYTALTPRLAQETAKQIDAQTGLKDSVIVIETNPQKNLEGLDQSDAMNREFMMKTGLDIGHREAEIIGDKAALLEYQGKSGLPVNIIRFGSGLPYVAANVDPEFAPNPEAHSTAEVAGNLLYTAPLRAEPDTEILMMGFLTTNGSKAGPEHIKNVAGVQTQMLVSVAAQNHGYNEAQIQAGLAENKEYGQMMKGLHSLAQEKTTTPPNLIDTAEVFAAEQVSRALEVGGRVVK